jgi:uncharacterized membrane protein YhaH (DUF805 family)
MNWYFEVLKKYAVFSGRARRKEYWMFVLFNLIIVFVLGLVIGLIENATNSNLSILVNIYQLAVLLPSIAVGVRRMHDTDHSGWWLLFPIVNLVFAVSEGTQGDNKYGSDPKAISHVPALVETAKAPTQCKVQFDADGKVVSVEVYQGPWTLKQNGDNKYYSQNANSLLQATEILKKMASIPPLTYYLVDTPDGTLGRDINGYFTEAPLKTKNLKVEFNRGKSGSVELEGLHGFGDVMKNQSSVALLKKNGQYGPLVLLMKCGECGYESPVETKAGDLERQCYCCGTMNHGSRGKINIVMGSGVVEI